MSSSIDPIAAGELGSDSPESDILERKDWHGEPVGGLDAVAACSFVLSFVSRLPDCTSWCGRLNKK
jgi:hypothetical protein